MVSLLGQLRQVLRRLRRAPLFTAVTLLTLAVGIGANTAVFSVVEGVLLEPLPYPRAQRLVGVWQTAPGAGIADLNMAPSNYFVFREQNRTFQDIGLYSGDSVSVTGAGAPEQVPALDVTDGTLSILGIPPLLGRTFSRHDDLPSSPATVVLTYGYWQRKFGGNRQILGKTIILDGKPRRIIGVMPRRFRFLDRPQLDLILPLQFDRAKTTLGNFSFEGLARLKPGVTLAQANADVGRMWPMVLRAFPPPPGFSLQLFEHARIGPNLRPLKRDVVGDVGKLLWILMLSLALVLLIACANVANLMLVRAEGRQQELAIRAALGSSRARIAADLWLESLILALLGGALGLGLAYGALRLLVALAPAGLPRLADIGLNGPVLLFSLAIAVLASLMCGAIPVVKYAGARAGTGLREGGRALSQSRERHRARNGLVLVQVALAFVLLICSGLMIRTFRALTAVSPGFAAPADVQTFHVDVPDAEVADPTRVARMEEQMEKNIAALPGVQSVGISDALPMTGSDSNDPIFAADRTYAQGELPPLRRFVHISPGYFHVLGTPLIVGRDFTWNDVYDKLPVAIISENFAREYWGGAASALGRRIRVSTVDDWRQIVGVVGDVHNDGVEQKAPTIAYWPLLQARFESQPIRVSRYVGFAIRSPRAGSRSLMNEVRRAVWAVDPSLPLARVHTLDYWYRRSLARASFTLTMLALAGGMALLLGFIGLYGVLAYSVAQRTREIGIRMALGAQPRALVRMFVRQGLALTATGVACGIVVAIAAARLMASLLFGVRPLDWATYGAVIAGLAAVAALASYLPSRRAAAVNPTEALRAE
ncbi:MAG: ABC transporter permease [Terriglobales bacterium]